MRWHHTVTKVRQGYVDDLTVQSLGSFFCVDHGKILKIHFIIIIQIQIQIQIQIPLLVPEEQFGLQPEKALKFYSFII